MGEHTHDPDAWGLTHLGVAPDALGITLTPLSDTERADTAHAIQFTALLIEDDNPAFAKRLRLLAELFVEGKYAPHDSPLAARFAQVRRERDALRAELDKALAMLVQANGMLARYADSIETQVGP